MEIDLIEDTSDHDETLESMPVGSIYLESGSVSEEGSHNNWQKYYPIWQSSRSVAWKQIGDCYEMTTEYLLTILQPYPGDEFYEEWQWSCPPDRCFQVRCIRSHNDFKIYDRLTDFEITINKSQLDNLKFNLGHWYAKSQARALGLKDSMKNKFLAHIEEPIALVTMQLLHDGIHAHFRMSTLTQTLMTGSLFIWRTSEALLMLWLIKIWISSLR